MVLKVDFLNSIQNTHWEKFSQEKNILMRIIILIFMNVKKLENIDR